MNIGIWGTGVIAAKMADTIRRMEDVTLYACASRTQERANCFANDYNCYKAYGSAEDMLQDREVDLVYIATPNFAHYDNTIACLRHGKAVLCEKPFALNYTQAKEMIELATEKHILLAEAMWMRYQPLAAKIVELINDGVIGKPRLLLANKGEADLAPEGLNPATGGSTLLNMGVYAINDAFLAFGSNVLNVSTSRIMLESGTDGANSITLEYTDGKLAILSSSLIAPTGNRWYICGENGMLEIKGLSRLQSITQYNRKREKVCEYKAEENYTGYEYEILACKKALLNGDIECPEMPHSETLAVMKLMDSIRETWEMTFPCEKEYYRV